MRNLLMLAGAAALAVSMPALAEKGGKGGGHGGGQAAKSHGGGHGGGGRASASRGGGGGKASKPPKAERQAFRGGGERKAERHAFRGGGEERRAHRRAARPEKAKRGSGEQQRLVRSRDRSDDRLVRRDFRDAGDRRAFRDEDRRLVHYDSNCPPGLAKKGNGCLPPGQARKVFGLGDRFERRGFAGYAMPASYRTFYADTPDSYYRYDDGGYIYRVDRQTSLISGLVPLLGGGFAVGQPLPTGYDVYNVPTQYRDTWYDTDEAYYRYGDNAIYQVDPQSGIIESIVALLAGDLNVGQALPTGYDVYNVPMDYRDEYADTDDTLYRYADGNIYQVDAQTQMIQAIVEMLV